MKRFFFFVSIVGLLCAACNKNEESTSKEGNAVLTINLVGSGSINPSNVGTPSQAEENQVNSFTVYIFTNSRLEKSSVVPTGLSSTITGISTGVKRVVVVANPPSGFPTLPEGGRYEYLSLATRYINLDAQENLSNGLVMTGETDVTLDAEPAVNTVNIPIRRIVAKINLGTITIDPAPGYNPALFTLNAVAIIKAKSLSTIGIPTVTTYEPFYSGIVGISVPIENVRTYLYEPISETDYSNRFFYVFANDNTDDNATLLTLVGTYNGQQLFFPFRIDSPTGNYIQRNTQHTINITLRRLGAGSPDPEIPSDPATLTVTVVAQDWVVVPIQNVEW